MIKNGQQQMFKIMGVFANLKSVVNDFPPSTSTEFFDIAQSVGSDIGTVLRIVTGYGNATDNSRKQIKGRK